MSVTIIVAIGIALAGSYIEYRARKSSSLVNRAYQNFWFSLVMTGIIGAGVTLLTGPAVGVGAVLGQLIGLATNEFTFKLYDEYIPAASMKYRKVKTQTAVVSQWKREHPQVVTNFVVGVKGIAALIGAFFVVVGAIIRVIGFACGFIAHPVQGTKQLIRH